MALFLASALIGCSDDVVDNGTQVEQSQVEQVAIQEPQELPTVTMTIAGYGDLVIELYPDIAPISVENFMTLVDSGFYDGLTFHRIIQGFMIQGGDPLGTGMGGSEDKIVGEFASNGIENNLKHTTGVLSMARSSDKNSASSQFFIMSADAPHLDGDYAAFGKVISGLEIVDELEKVATGSNDKPVEDVVIEKVVIN